MKVDTRAGSKELIEPLAVAGAVVESVILPSGDIEIMGTALGQPYFIGVEHKTIEDVLQSMRNGRAAEQLRAMKDAYNISWLLVEGRFEERHGGLHVLRGSRWCQMPGSFSQREFDSWLLTTVQRLGVLYWHTEDQAESVRWLVELERWWTIKDFEEHRSHLAVYTPEVISNPFDKPPSRCHRAALAIAPGIGQTKAKRAADHFKTVRRMVNSTPEEWQKIEGVGKKIARQIVAAMDEEG